MKTNSFYYWSLVLILFISCKPDDKISEPEKFKLGEKESIVKSHFGEGSSSGHVIITDSLDNQVLIWIKDKNRYDPEQELAGADTDVVPVETHRSKPIEGEVVDFETLLEVPIFKLPLGISSPFPDFDKKDINDTLKEAYKKYKDTQDKEVKRVVVVTQNGASPNEYIVVRVYDGLGKLLSQTKKKGKFKKYILNENTGEKTFVVAYESFMHWILVDLKTGLPLSDSKFGIDLDTDLKSIEVVRNHIVVIEDYKGQNWIRVRIFGRDGTLENVMDVPGHYVTSTTDGKNIKALIFNDKSWIYRELLNIGNGKRLSGKVGFPSNGIKGRSMHAQYDDVSGEKRFLDIVYDAQVKETVITIMDSTSRIVATRVLPGMYREHVKLKGRKVFAIQREKEMDVVAIDLLTGRQENLVTRPGILKMLDALKVSSDGKVLLKTNNKKVQYRFKIF